MSFIHYLTVGFLELRADRLGPGIRPMPLRPLDRGWVESYLPRTRSGAAEAFWFDEAGCLWSTLDWLDVARKIVDHHGAGCVAVHHNQGLAVYPPSAVVEQFRVNGWPPPEPGTAWLDAELFRSGSAAGGADQEAEPPAEAKRGVRDSREKGVAKRGHS